MWWGADMKASVRYHLVQVKGQNLLVSSIALRIIRAVQSGSLFTYDELSRKVNCKISTLYVFCERLEKVKLLKRSRLMAGTPSRMRTFISRAQPFKQFPVKVIK